MNQTEVRNAIDMKQEMQEALGLAERIRRAMECHSLRGFVVQIEAKLKRCITMLRDVDASNGRVVGAGTLHAIDGDDVEVDPMTADEMVDQALDRIVAEWRADEGDHVPCPAGYIAERIRSRTALRQFAA